MVREGDTGNEFNPPSSNRGANRNLIADIVGAGIPKFVENAAKAAMAMELMGFVKTDPPADPARAASERFKEQAEAVIKANGLKTEQAQAVRELGQAFFSGPPDRVNGVGMSGVLSKLPPGDREKVVDSFATVLMNTANDKPGMTDKLNVTFEGDDAGNYKIFFQGSLVNGGNGKMRFNSADSSIVATTKGGADLYKRTEQDKHQGAVVGFRDSVRDEVASGFKPAKEEDKPAAKKEADKLDPNTEACRDAFKKILERKFPGNKDAQEAGLAVFDHHTKGNELTFKTFQETFKGESDANKAAKVRDESLTALFDIWQKVKVDPVPADVLKRYEGLKTTNPEQYQQFADALSHQTTREKWAAVAKGKTLSEIPDAVKAPDVPAPPVPGPMGASGVDTLGGLAPNKLDKNVAMQIAKLKGLGSPSDADRALLKTLDEFKWTSDEPQYQYARAAYLKAVTDGKLDDKQLKSLRKALDTYVAYYSNNKLTDAPDIEAIKKFLTP